MNPRIPGYGALSALLVLPALLVPGTSDGLHDPEETLSRSSRFAWGDYDGDGLDDAYVILASGHGGLLHNEGDGTLRDVTTEAGLDGVAFPSFASWRDVDGDGALDLLVGTSVGAGLFRNLGGAFEDVTQPSGLDLDRGAEAAHWLDYDADGRADLHVRTRGGDALFHALAEGRFELAELPLAAPRLAGEPVALGTSPKTGAVDARSDASADAVRRAEREGRGPGGATAPRAARGEVVTSASGATGVVVTGGVQYVGSAPQCYACPESIVDQADGVSCMNASSEPTLGLLYPISEDLFVATSGSVGVGTTAPAGARLHAVGSDGANPGLEDGEDALRADGGYGYYGGTGGTLAGGAGQYMGGVGLVATGGTASQYGGDGLVATGADVSPTNVAGAGARITGGDGGTGGPGAIVRGGGSFAFGVPGSFGAEIRGGDSTFDDGGDGLVVDGGAGVDGGRGLVVTAGQGYYGGGDGLVVAGGSADYGQGGRGLAVNGGAGYFDGGHGLVVTGGSGGYDGGAGLVATGGGGGSSPGPAIVAQGRVGVGTAFPDRLLHVMNGASGTQPTTNSSLVVESSGESSISLISPSDQETSLFFGNPDFGPNAGAIIYNPFSGPSNSMVFRTADTSRLAITSSGNVGIGTTIPDRPLHVFANSSWPLRVEGNASPGIEMKKTGEASSWAIYHSDTDNLNVRDSTSGVTRMAIGGTSGNVSIGNGDDAGSFTLTVNGTAGKPGGGSWSVFSDARLKKNVEDIEGALDTLLALRGVTFEYEDPESIGELTGTRIGFIAQEVEEVVPDWVEENDSGYKQLTVRGFEALAVEALREQQRELDGLRSLPQENAELRGELAALRRRVERLESIEDEIAALKEALAER